MNKKEFEEIYIKGSPKKISMIAKIVKQFLGHGVDIIDLRPELKKEDFVEYKGHYMGTIENEKNKHKNIKQLQK